MSGLSFSLGGKTAQKPKIAFGLKKPSGATPAGVFAADSDDEELARADKRQRTEERPSPSGQLDPQQQTTAEKLAEFVAKHGRSFEEVTRQRNPHGGPFKFLFDTASPEFRFYEERLAFHTARLQGGISAGAPAPPPPAVAQAPAYTPAAAPAQPAAQRPLPMPPAARPAPAPAGAPARNRWDQDPGAAAASTPAAGAAPRAATGGGDSLAAMEAFAQQAAKRDEARAEAEARVPLLNETAYDRRRTTAVYKQDGSRGHHMQDYIPPEELAAFLAKSGSKESQAQAEALEAAQRIRSDNIGHRLLSQMGWKEGQGLGSAGAGRAAPLAAGAAAMGGEKRGLGAEEVSAPQAGEDQYETYRKRMMLGYKHRPNPLGNPRKSYY